MNDRGPAFRLWQHDCIRLCRRNRIEIGVDQSGLQAVHPHYQIRPLRICHRIFEKSRGGVARARFAVQSDRILKIDDQRVGAARHRFVERARAVGRGEQE
jgi:hypothetical protein